MVDSSNTPAALEPFLPQLLNGTFTTMMGQLQEHLADCGYDDLRPTHFMNVLRFMDCGGTRPTDLARMAGMTPQAMGDLVAYLEERGYIKRVDHPADGRVRIVVWAERGEAAAADANEFFHALEQRWAADVGEDMLAHLKQTLTTLVQRPVS
jgi:DNA-binding MarR family transcriptional regulator